MAKDKEVMYRIGENKLELSQSSKGFWYCTSITVNTYNILDAVIVMDRAIEEVEKLLKKHNTKEDKINDAEG